MSWQRWPSEAEVVYKKAKNYGTNKIVGSADTVLKRSYRQPECIVQCRSHLNRCTSYPRSTVMSTRAASEYPENFSSVIHPFHRKVINLSTATLRIAPLPAWFNRQERRTPVKHMNDQSSNSLELCKLPGQWVASLNFCTLTCFWLISLLSENKACESYVWQKVVMRVKP